MAVLVEEVQQAKSGKSLRVKLGGSWYGANLDSGLNGAKGTMIEAEIQTSEKYGAWIKGWKPSVVPGMNAPVKSPEVETREPIYAEPNKNVAPYWLPFASNTVNAAIAAGIIKDPQQIRAWLIACKVAAVSHDNDIPF